MIHLINDCSIFNHVERGEIPMMENWLAFNLFMALFTFISIFAAVFAKPIKRTLKDLDVYSDGKKTDHHTYIPYN